MNQKKEDLLNLALLVPEEERERTYDLNTGFNETDRTWELIVRYSSSDEALLQQMNLLSAVVKILSGGYAIVTVRENLVDAVASLPEVIYVEKPKRFVFQDLYDEEVSCILPVKREPLSLTGQGCLIAIIDTGIDYRHPAFYDAEGRTRILAIYDEQNDAVYDREAIETGQVPYPFDYTGHGTHVAGIAAQTAPGAELIVVRLGTDEFATSARLMEAVDWCVSFARNAGKPVAVNISYGNNYGAHDGTSLLETYINTMSQEWKTSIVIGTGNEATKRIHSTGTLTQGQTRIETLAVGTKEQSVGIQLWKHYGDILEITLVDPSGKRTILPITEMTIGKYIVADTILYIYVGSPQPYSSNQEILFQLIGREDRMVTSGIWRLELYARQIQYGWYNFWLVNGGTDALNTGFENATPETTLTIPSTAYFAISVGAYDSRLKAYADFSGRGFTQIVKTVKPDLVAPGVAITSARAGGGSAVRSGTSMATPFVTASAALLMEWGIVRGNDLFLYGERLKAYLIKGAKRLPGYDTWPNRELGFGYLCLNDSFPYNYTL